MSVGSCRCSNYLLIARDDLQFVSSTQALSSLALTAASLSEIQKEDEESLLAVSY
jgi:hypothetical protein